MKTNKESKINQVIELSQKEVTNNGWLNGVVKFSSNNTDSSSVTISFNNVKYICSEVMTSLVEMRCRLINLGSKLVIVVNTKELSKLFKVVHFDEMFDIQFVA